MYLTFRGDFRSITRNWNINSRTKLLSQFICMKLIGWLKEQLPPYMSGAEIWNRLTLNNLLFLLKITGKFHYMSEEKVAKYFGIKFLWLCSSECPHFSGLRKQQSCLYLPVLYFILLLGAHPPPFSLQYVLVEQFYTWRLYLTKDLELLIKTFSSGGNQALRLWLSNSVCLFSQKFVYLTLSHQTSSDRCWLTDYNMPPFFPLSFTLLTSKLLSHIILTLPNIQMKKLGQGSEGGRYCMCLQWWGSEKQW